jgi:hypothetical protein
VALERSVREVGLIVIAAVVGNQVLMYINRRSGFMGTLNTWDIKIQFSTAMAMTTAPKKK